MAELIGGEVVTELVKQLFAISRKALRCRDIAGNLAIMIESVQPTIKEILYSGVKVSPHRQVQLRIFSETLEKCRKLTEKVLKCNRWNMVRQLYHAKKMEDLEKKISVFLKCLPLYILADVHHHRVETEVRFDRIHTSVDSLGQHLGSMKIRGAELAKETTMEIVTDGDLRKAEEGEGRLIWISGKPTLAEELALAEEIRGHFGDRDLFLTMSQSPNLDELRTLMWGFLTGHEAGFGAIHAGV